MKKSFRKLSDARLLVESNGTASKCKGNPYFTAEQPTVILLENANADFMLAIDAAGLGNHQAIAEKNAQKKALITLLEKVLDLASAAANGDPVKEASLGVITRKTPQPSAPLVKPAPPVLTPGAVSGEVLSTGKKQREALGMVHMYTLDPITAASVWFKAFTGSRKHLFAGLPSGTRIWFKLAVIGVRNQYEESDAVSYMVQ